MSTEAVFQVHLVSGYVAWALCFRAFVVPWLRSIPRPRAFRVMAMLHSFRFFGLVFIVPGVVGANLPAQFATFAAYGDLVTGVLAMLAVATFRIRALFWVSVVAFNAVGAADLIIDYGHAIQFNLPAQAGQLGAAWAIPVLYVPALMITHVLAFYWLLRREPATGLPGVESPAARGT